MPSLKEAVNDFLAQKTIAVAGVSRSGQEAANGIYRKLRKAGYQVYAVNPKADELEGDPCYPDLKSVPADIEAVMVATHPQVTEAVVRECAELGIKRVWMHRSFGEGSVSEAAVAYGRDQDITVIDGGCPMMFLEPDIAHRCMRWFLDVTGSLPKQVGP
jgi:predicted CoA-binding protein